MNSSNLTHNGYLSRSGPEPSPARRRPLPTSPRKTGQGIYIVEAAKAPNVKAMEFNFDSLITMAPEPKEQAPTTTRSIEIERFVLRSFDEHLCSLFSFFPDRGSAHHPSSSSTIDNARSRFNPHASVNEQRHSQIPAAFPPLKRGPDTTAPSDSPSKRIKIEKMTTSLTWDRRSTERDNQHLRQAANTSSTSHFFLRCFLRC
jgi:hypothetical protein